MKSGAAPTHPLLPVRVAHRLIPQLRAQAPFAISRTAASGEATRPYSRPGAPTSPLKKGGYLQALHSAPSFAVLDAQPPFTETTRSWYSRARRATAPMRFVRLRARRAGFPFVVAWSNITTFPRQRPNSSWTIDGRLAISASSTRAGPTGRRRPCSQFLSVPSRTPMLRAKSGWDIPVLPRIATTSGADTSIRCAVNPARSPFTYA